MDGSISKSDLKNIKMYVGHVMKEYKETRLACTWSLPGFFKEESSALYTKRVESFDFDLNLKKDKNSFVVRVSTKEWEMFLGMVCNVFLQDSRIPISVDARQLSNTLYQFTIQSNAFQVLKDCALSQSIETMKLRFEVSIEEREIFFPHDYGRDNSVFEELKEYKVILKRFPGDFTMQTVDAIKVFNPKYLFAARCKYFRNYFNDPRNDEIKCE